jgi:DNA-binding MarR family transcriptional regulator
MGFMDTKSESAVHMRKPLSPDTAKDKGHPQNFYNATNLLQRDGGNVGMLIKQVQSSLTRMMDDRVSPLGLTAMQWRPMVMVRYWNINTPAELARQTHVDTGAMTRTLDRLEAKHFITRQRCPDDRRVVRIALTEAGNDVVEQILPAVAATLNTHLQDFSKAEVDTLLSLLRRMLANAGAETALPSLHEA